MESPSPATRGSVLIGNLAEDIAALVTTPNAAAAVPPEQVPELLGALDQVRVVLWARLLGHRDETPASDRLLGIDEAAARLGTTRDWLRRHGELPFLVRLSPGQIRYSQTGIEKFMRRHQKV